MVNHPWHEGCHNPATSKDDDRSVPAVRQKEASEKRRHCEEEAEVMREGGEQRRHREYRKRPARVTVFAPHAAQQANGSQGDARRQQQKERVGARLAGIPDGTRRNGEKQRQCDARAARQRRAREYRGGADGQYSK